MLKALLDRATRWAREETEDSQAEELLQAQDYLSGLQITHTGEYHLERLQALLRLRFQQDFGRASTDDIRRLIAYAARVQDADIQRELLLLYLNCPPDTQALLRQGDLLPEDNVIRKAPNPFEW